MDLKISKIVRSNRKTISLAINCDAGLVVRAPWGVDDSYIKRIVYQKRAWIRDKKNLVDQKNRLQVRRKFVQGEKFIYLGGSYELDIVDRDNPVLDFNGKFTLSRYYKDNARQFFVEWYKRQALDKISQRVDFYSSITKDKYTKVRITSARQRWGSCARKGSLNFSWRLIMAPLEVIDYVVVHEIVHLRVRSHAKEFWAQLEKLMPDYRVYRKWLKDKGHLLVL